MERLRRFVSTAATRQEIPPATKYTQHSEPSAMLCWVEVGLGWTGSPLKYDGVINIVFVKCILMIIL